MAKKQDINTATEVYFRKLSVTFNSYVEIKQSDVTNSENFYTIYSPKKLKLGPRDAIVLDFKFNITTSKELDPWIILLPTLKANALAIVEKRETPKKTTELHLQNQSYYYGVNVKKEQCMAFIFLLGELNTDIIKTEYKNLNYMTVFSVCHPVRSHVAPTVEGAGPGLSVQQLELTALVAPLAKPARSYVLPLVAVKDVKEVKPVHVMVTP